MQFGGGPLPLSHCTNLLPRTELPVAGPPQPLLTIPTAPAAVRNQSHSGSQHNASAIPRKNCTQSARKRPHSQWFAALVLGNCTSHSHAKTHAMPLTIARSHTSSHSFARKLALTIHRAASVNLQARLFVKSQSTIIVPRPPAVTGWSRSQKHWPARRSLACSSPQQAY